METLSFSEGFVAGAILILVFIATVRWILNKDTSAGALVRKHFPKRAADGVDISERRFPARVRADIQRAIDALPENGFQIVAFHGVQNDDHYQGLTLAGSMQWKDYPATIPAAYEDVDIGSNETIRVVKNGLWLLKQDEEPVAIMVSRLQTPCGPSYSVLHVQSYDTSAGKVAAKKIVDWLEAFIQEAPSYRGKILSLEALEDAYSGAATGIRVHKLRDVERDQIILPDSTLKLLERNVIQFTRNRAKLASFGQSTRKGLLFYGPPGTGKTHTIHYLTRALEGHTTLIISAEQVQDLADYMALARLLQPSIVVLEDVDLIARDRGEMHSPQQESLLNKLLNEMDGLKEDAEILFILTTNRPEALEAALASRPGRVDQAIEFPLPNEEGRAKLVQLYSLGMNLSPDCIAEIVRRTEGVSASFIKELMRRSVQFHLEHNGSETVSREDVDNALDEMLFHGGKLNLKLLGASSRIGYQTVEA